MIRPSVIVAAFVLAAIAVGVSLYLYLHHRSRATPELVLQLPASQCNELAFGPWGLARGDGVDDICKRHGVPDGPYFALKARRAIRFKLTQFNGVHGEIIYVHADPDTVYFYRYEKRYRPLVWTP